MAEDYKVQLSLKFGARNDMVNLRCDSPEELAKMAGELADLAVVVVTAAEEFQAKATVAAAFPGTEAATSAPRGDVCAHGVAWSEKSGEKNGKRWSGKFCQVENDPAMPKCKAIWTN